MLEGLGVLQRLLRPPFSLVGALVIAEALVDLHQPEPHLPRVRPVVHQALLEEGQEDFTGGPVGSSRPLESGALLHVQGFLKQRQGRPRSREDGLVEPAGLAEALVLAHGAQQPRRRRLEVARLGAAKGPSLQEPRFEGTAI